MLTSQVVITNQPEQAVSSLSGSPATMNRPTPDALTVLDLHKSFRAGFLKKRVRGIEGVSFSVPQGSVFGLLGHNGAGKTTTINCILDLVHPDGGEVRLMGQDHRQRQARARVGYLPERPYFFEHLTGHELLAFYGDLLGLDNQLKRERIETVLRQTGMSQHAQRRLKKYSKGMLQRIGLAQTLLGDPDLLILDEPMSGLDPMGRRDVRRLLQGLKADGKTIIFSSHIVPDVEAVADQVGILRDGHLVATRSLSDFTGTCQYEVRLEGQLSDSRIQSLPRLLRENLTVVGGQLQFQAAGVGELRRTLDVCHQAEVPVRAVDTRRSALEDFFVETHGQPETTGQEVVA